MPILAINTASSKAAIALIENNSLINEDSWPSQNNEAEKLMPAIDKMLEKSGYKYKDIDKVLVIKGPGSFTGLRIGVAVANTIAYLNNCEIYGLDTFSYWWHSTKKTDDTALLIFAGSRGVYVSLPHKKDFLLNAELKNIDEINDYLNGKGIKKIFGDISGEQKAKIENIEFIDIKKTFGENIKEIDFKLLKPEKIIKPEYVKKPGITISKKKLF